MLDTLARTSVLDPVRGVHMLLLHWFAAIDLEQTSSKW